jgi:hypothetical protein
VPVTKLLLCYYLAGERVCWHAADNIEPFAMSPVGLLFYIMWLQPPNVGWLLKKLAWIKSGAQKVEQV